MQCHVVNKTKCTHTHTQKKLIYKIHRFLKFISETGNCEDQSPTRSSTAGTGSCEKKA